MIKNFRFVLSFLFIRLAGKFLFQPSAHINPPMSKANSMKKKFSRRYTAKDLNCQFSQNLLHSVHNMQIIAGYALFYILKGDKTSLAS